MLNVDLPKNKSSKIKVLGVGGGGSNAVNHMYKKGIEGVDFIICNTDLQSLEISPVPVKIQIGEKGLGAGSKPEVGRKAAEEKIEEFREILEKSTEMLFITAGMGGGTGTGAAPVIAKLAREMVILTVGIITMPFSFEGKRRKLQAEEGLKAMREHVDALIIISNDKLREIYGNLKITEAFSKADDVLTTAAKGIAEIITVVAHVNVDLEDVKTVMTDSGTAILGSAVTEGEDRAILAAEQALTSPLLNDNHIAGAENVLLYLSYGEDELTMDEVSDITDYIQDQAGNTAEIIWGMGKDESLGKSIKVTLIATGFNKKEKTVTKDTGDEQVEVHNLDEENTATRDKSGTETEESRQLADVQDITVISVAASKEEEKIPSTLREETSQNAIPLTETEAIPGDITEPTLFTKETGGRTETAKEEEPVSGKRQNEMEEKLKNLSLNFDSKIQEMEQVPAYLRKGVKLQENAGNPEEEISTTYLDSDENELKTKNKFLHNRVD